MLTDGLKKIDHKPTAKPETEMTPAERGEDASGAPEAMPATTPVEVDGPVAPAAAGTIEVGLTVTTRELVTPLIATVVKARHDLAALEDKLSDAALAIGACNGLKFNNGTRFEFRKDADGNYTSIAWFPT